MVSLQSEKIGVVIGVLPAWGWAVIAAVLGTLLVALLALRWFDRSMRGVMQSARRLAEGDLAERVRARGPLHLTELSSSLNQMAGQLEDRMSTVVEQRNAMGAMLSSMAEGVLALDLNEQVLSMNRAARELLGVEPRKIIGLSIQEAVRNTALHTLVGQTIEQGTAMQGETTLRGARESEPERYVQVQTAPLRDSQGRRLGVLVVLHDVTQLRKLESVRRDFVANVSHEVKTPVSAVKAAVETMLDNPDVDREQAQRFLLIIQRQADRLEAIVEDLLVLTRLEQDDREEVPELMPQLVGPAVAAAIETCGGKAADKKMSIVSNVSASLRAQVNGPMLEQAVINLIDNAVKYSPERTRVDVNVQQAGEEVVIEVSDQGRGIAPHHLPRIFERFYRTDRARSRELGGTGLGLSIVKHVAEAHGGRVSVDSKPGQGSTFRIHLVPASLIQPVSSAGSDEATKRPPIADDAAA